MQRVAIRETEKRIVDYREKADRRSERISHIPPFRYKEFAKANTFMPVHVSEAKLYIETCGTGCPAGSST